MRTKLRNCKLVLIDSQNDELWKVKESNEYSQFEEWALDKAMEHIGYKSQQGHNNWCWVGGSVLQKIFEGDEKIETLWFGLCTNSMPVLEVMDSNGELKRYVVFIDEE